MKRNNMGITLIALVITIVVLLILAGVSIAMLTGDNGLITKANEAKIENALGGVKEAMKLEQGEKKIQGINLTPEVLLSEGRVGRTVQLKDDGNYYMYYALKENAYSQMGELGKGNRASLKDVFLIDDKFNVRYIDKNGKEYGDEIEEKILTDETEVRFANKGFSEYVSNISGVKEEDMQFQWMKNQTSLTLNKIDITDLEDLVFFPNLITLNISNMELKTLQGIENCKNLKNFYVIDVQIEDYITLASLSNVETIYIQGAGSLKNPKNFIDSIKNFEKLNNLSLYFTNLTDLNFLNTLHYKENLTSLNLGVNKIKNLEPIEKFTSLETLDLRNNLIIDITPVKSLVNLKNLNLTNNDIVDIIPLEYNKNLQNLYLKGNPKIDGNRANYSEKELKALDEIGKILDRNGNIYLDSEQLGLFNNYKSIDLTSQNLSTLDLLEGMTQIENLTLTDNKLTLEDKKSQDILSSMINLKVLYISNNLLRDMTAINNLKNLKILYIQGNNNVDLSQIEDIISNLYNLRLDTDALKTINNCDSDKITNLNIDNSIYLTEIPDLSKFYNLKSLSLVNLEKVNDFSSVSKIRSLNSLSLQSNNLHNSMLDFSELNNLQSLNLENCSLWSEDLENLKALKNNNNNSLINPTALLELNPSTKIKLTGNVNLTEEAKTKLKERFGSNVTF